MKMQMHDGSIGTQGFGDALPDGFGGTGYSSSGSHATAPSGGEQSSDAAVGGTSTSGGASMSGGNAAAGGASAAVGGAFARGGTSASDGAVLTGGNAAVGGASASGSIAVTGGALASGGALAVIFIRAQAEVDQRRRIAPRPKLTAHAKKKTHAIDSMTCAHVWL